ncbi:ATP-binding protein [Azoarcus sp. KH32C]|uniref:ATP-binding protein n=1 Tax=Azoarcus sp. KH32C TaxID=748247 RepID=UPI0002385F09|nr:ATP-binding protein [Azoarcus sp. KH32C]BAL25585.1 histidine kinase [Azoarcus sp. KH32C]
MTIAAKLRFSYLVLGMLALVIGVLGHREIMRVGDEFDYAVNRTQPVVSTLQEIRYQAMRVEAAAHGHHWNEAASDEGPAANAAIPPLDALVKADERYRELMNRYFANEQDMAKPVHASVANLHALARKHEQAGATSTRQADVERDKALNALLLAVDTALQCESAELEEYQETVTTTVAEHARTVAVGTALAMLATLLGGIYFSRRLTRPIVTLRNVAIGLGGGNLELRAPITSRDEIGELAGAFNDMAQALDNTMVSRQHLEAIIDSMSEGVLVIGASGRIKRANRRARELFHAPGETLAGKSAAELLPAIADWFASPAGIPDTAIREIELPGTSGTPLSLLLAVSPILDGNTMSGKVLTLVDIGERKRAEAEIRARAEEFHRLNRRLEQTTAQLLQSEKLAAVGQLAAGIADEIDSPIGFVNGNLGTVHKHLRKLLQVLAVYERHEAVMRHDAGAAREINDVRKGVDVDQLKEDSVALLRESRDGLTHVRRIVQDLEEFSHPANDDWQFADLHKGIDSTLNIVWNEIKCKATLVKDFGLLPEIECLPSELNQVFMHLLVNAAHAIGDKGTITIRTAAIGSDRVAIEIADDGKGIAPGHLSRLFEPFFTTKPAGQGSGLGLSLSYGIVRKHRGTIEVDSTLGKGTRFRICLPVRQAPEAVLNESA